LVEKTHVNQTDDKEVCIAGRHQGRATRAIACNVAMVLRRVVNSGFHWCFVNLWFTCSCCDAHPQSYN